ncbi:MAG: hypothetical protein Q7T55_04905 [Solirubrobacteraceae bacterium]|nr:hypothetical protein [Solirubrobacteraceae bacterium]
MTFGVAEVASGAENAVRSQVAPASAVTVLWQAPLKLKGLPAVTVQAGTRPGAAGVTEVCGRVSESASVVATPVPGPDPRTGLTVPSGQGRQAWRCFDPGARAVTQIVLSWAHRAITVEADRTTEALVACPASPTAAVLATGTHCGDGARVTVLDGRLRGAGRGRA